MPVPGLFVVQPTTCLAQLIWQSSLRCHWLLSSSPSPRCHLMRWVIPLLWRSLISLLCCEFCKLRLDRVFFFSHLEMQYCIRKKIFCLEIELLKKKKKGKQALNAKIYLWKCWMSLKINILLFICPINKLLLHFIVFISSVSAAASSAATVEQLLLGARFDKRLFFRKKPNM